MTKKELLEKYIEVNSIANKRLQEYKEMIGTSKDYKFTYDNYILAADIAATIWKMYEEAEE